MPMQFGKVTVETPQEVLARLQQERRAMTASGNVSAIQQATVSNSLDALFGNPEVKQSQAIQSRMKMAQQSIQPQEGDDDITSEMRRVSAMRDAVQDLDPSLANEMTTQLLQLGTIKTERAKLQAQQTLAQHRDERGEIKLQSDLANTSQTMAARLQDMNSQSGKGTNFWKRDGQGIKHITIPEENSLEKKARMAQGWIEGTGPTTEAEANGIVNPTKAETTDLQKNYVEAQGQANALATIAQRFNPDFLKLPNQWLMGGRAYVERLGLKLPADQMAKLEQYTQFKQDSVDAFNRYIKFITGAQMAVAEAERIQKGFPNADKDSPTQFQAKMRETARQILGVQRRTGQALKSGIQIGPDQIEACKSGNGPCVWDSIQVPSVSDEEVDQFLGKFGMPARASRPQPGKDGWTVTKSGARVKELK